MDIPVYHYDTLDSTNTQCKRLAAEGAASAVVTADCQTAGRGRMGRRFQSPPGLGMYLSVLFPEVFFDISTAWHILLPSGIPLSLWAWNTAALAPEGTISL